MVESSQNNHQQQPRPLSNSEVKNLLDLHRLEFTKQQQANNFMENVGNE